jgi:hypothetical protein
LKENTMCSSGCPTPGAHSTFGECLRSKNLQIQDVDAHKYNKVQSGVIDDYVTARRAGIQPEGVTANAVRFANEQTDKTGTPFRADV